MISKADKARLKRLRRLYDIQGDGVARLRMDKAINDGGLQETVRKLRDMPMVNDSHSDESRGKGPATAQ